MGSGASPGCTGCPRPAGEPGAGAACGHPHPAMEGDGDPVAPPACPPQATPREEPRCPGIPEPCPPLTPVPCRQMPPYTACCQCPPSPARGAGAARVSQFIARCRGGGGYTRQTLQEAVSERGAVGAAGRGWGRAVPLTPPACSLPTSPWGCRAPPCQAPSRSPRPPRPCGPQRPPPCGHAPPLR